MSEMPDQESSTTDRVREALVTCYKAHGAALCLDHRRVERLLTAEFPDRPWPVVAAHAAVREGVAADLVANVGDELGSMLFERFSRRLVERVGLSKGSAAWAVSSWAEAMGRPAPAQGAPRLRGAPVKLRYNRQVVTRPGGAPWHLRGHRRMVTDIAFSPDGELIATSSLDRTVRLWDTRTGHQVRCLMGGHRDWVRAVAFSPDGKRLASVGDDGAARLWDPTTGERTGRLRGHEGWVRDLSWSPDGRILVTGGRDGYACLWEAHSLQQLARLGPFEGGVSRLSFDPRGQWLAVCRTNALEIWDLETPRRAQLAEVAGDRAVVVAGRGNLVYVGDERGAKCWSVSDGRWVRAYDSHRGAVRTMAIHPNGKALITGGRDQAVRLWHAVEGWEGYVFQFRNVRITGLGFHPAGHIGVCFSDGNAQMREMIAGGSV
ncbi:MAG: hypothetical protein AAFV53_06820 [Myxococcota bacterium]